MPGCIRPIYRYIFSGRRRDHDFQECVERQLQQFSLEGQVVLIDLAISERHDVGNPILVKQLMSLMWAGVVQGLLIAPPCETWSQARFQREQERDPRPLRSADDPFSIPGLTVKELGQVETANMLLYVAITLLLVATLTATPAVLEHPAEPDRPERPSIWKLPWIRALIKKAMLTKTLIYQAYYGGVAWKPTHLVHCWNPRLEHLLRTGKQPVQWQQLVTLKGRDHRGGWFTARAKEYPGRLNDIFAQSFVQEQRNKTHCDTAPLPIPHDIQQIVDTLLSNHIDRSHQVMRPDYGGHHHTLDRMD